METRQSLTAIRSYIETALRLTDQAYNDTTDMKYKEHLLVIIVALKTAIESINSD